MSIGERLPGRALAWRAASLLLLVGSLWCLLLWGDRTSPDDPTYARAELPPADLRTASDAGETISAPVPAFKRAAPRALRIPAIDVRTPLVSLGFNRDGTVEVPTDPARAGWFQPGVRPGGHGSAVLLGHVDSVDGSAVFFRLGSLQVGDVIAVLLQDRSTVRFGVTSVTVHPNAEFPAEMVYKDHGPRRLTLVTCGGDYDASRGGYQANVVVRTTWIPAVPGHRPPISRPHHLTR